LFKKTNGIKSCVVEEGPRCILHQMDRTYFFSLSSTNNIPSYHTFNCISIIL